MTLCIVSTRGVCTPEEVGHDFMSPIGNSVPHTYQAIPLRRCIAYGAR